MSTNIQNGFRLHIDTFAGLVEFLKPLRDTFAEKALDHVRAVQIGEAVEAYDINTLTRAGHPVFVDTQRALEDIEEQRSPLSRAWRETVDQRQKLRAGDAVWPKFDLDFSISLIPHDGSLYGLVHCGQHEWVAEFLKSTALVEHFPYWNGTDGPEDISEEDWAARGRLWNEILPYFATPSMTGFEAAIVSTSLISPSPQIFQEDIDRLAPSLDARAQRPAETVVMQRVHAASGDMSDRGYMRAFNEMKFERREEVLAVAEEIAPLLTERITHQALTTAPESLEGPMVPGGPK